MKIEVDVKWQLIKIDGKIKYRTAQMEIDIINFFIENPNKTISAERLAEIFNSTERSMVAWISNIRSNYPAIAGCIETVHGKGYRWVTEEEKES